VSRAKEVLKRLEREHRVAAGAPGAEPDPSQLALFGDATRPHPVVTELKELDLDRMTPIEALNTLAALKRKSTP
jgi:DNA mismatch repair ATPase MutS